jgi:outer membrane protein
MTAPAAGSVSGWDMDSDVSKKNKGVNMQASRARIVAAALLAVSLSTGAWAVEQQIVFVNLDRAFTEYYKTKLADTQLKQQAEEFNDERKKLVDEYEKLQANFTAIRDEAQNTALSEDVRSEKRNLAEEKLVDVRECESKIRRFDESRRKQLDDQSRRMRKRIVDEIRTMLESYARTQGYQAVIDSSGQSFNGVELILFTDPKIDITDNLLDILNKGQKDLKDVKDVKNTSEQKDQKEEGAATEKTSQPSQDVDK